MPSPETHVGFTLPNQTAPPGRDADSEDSSSEARSEDSEDSEAEETFSSSTCQTLQLLGFQALWEILNCTLI